MINRLLKKKVNKKEVKEPRRVKRAIKKLHHMIDIIDYYMGHTGSQEFKELVKDAAEIENLLHELAIDKKIDHIRLAQKLKHIWEADAKKEKENK